MSKKIPHVIFAWASLMLEKKAMEYKNSLFTGEEIAERTISIFPKENKVAESYIRNLGGTDKYFREGSKDSLAEYYRLTKAVDFTKIADLLLRDDSKWEGKSDYTEPMIVNALEEYMSMVQDMTFPVQNKNPQLQSREAVWIATAVLAFNEYHRTGSNNPEQYFFRQKTIGKLASQFTTGGIYRPYSQMACKECVAGLHERKSENNDYLYPNPNGNDTRRLTYKGEYRNTRPDIDNQFMVNTILGVLPLERVIEFVDTTYTAMFVPADDADDERFERYIGTIDDDRLFQIACERGTEEPTLSEHRETATYARDRYVAAAAKRWAKGKCQLCDNDAPFETPSGEPYLESHHIRWLSQGGADTIFNVVALCPNCHRRMHILNDAKDVKCLKMKVDIAMENYGNAE